MSSIDHMAQSMHQQQTYSVLYALGGNAQPLWALVHSNMKGRPSDPPLHTDCENKEVGKSILGTQLSLYMLVLCLLFIIASVLCKPSVQKLN